ncbi:MAG TPA: hypothetical protein VK636_13175 [Gemmatimonadaceae bacterium]|nr:hypothetical protein [Gemmatimonadaceae bacterium]
MSTPFVVAALLQGPDMIPPEAIKISEAFFTTIAVIALGIPLIRAISKRWDRPAQLPQTTSPDVTARLERIEQAVEAVAIEVERIAESQRFAAKLMAEQQQRSLPRSDAQQ